MVVVVGANASRGDEADDLPNKVLLSFYIPVFGCIEGRMLMDSSCKLSWRTMKTEDLDVSSFNKRIFFHINKLRVLDLLLAGLVGEGEEEGSLVTSGGG
jgi:hypothetical protein